MFGIGIADNETEYFLSDPQADPLAVILFRNLAMLSDDFVLVGHQDALAYGMGRKGEKFRSDINDVCGDFIKSRKELESH